MVLDALRIIMQRTWDWVMRYSRAGGFGNGMKPGRRGVAPPRMVGSPQETKTRPVSPLPHRVPSSEPAAEIKQKSIFGRIGQGRDFNFRRFEFSCLVVAEFACLLLALPVYLFFGRIGVWHIGPPPSTALSQGLWGQTLRFIALVGGTMGILFIPVMSKQARGRWLWMFAASIFLLVLLMAGDRHGALLALIGFGSMCLFSLVMLDAITAVRPAAIQSHKFIKLQMVTAVVVMVLWFVPMVLGNHPSVLHGWIRSDWMGMEYPMTRVGPIAAELAGVMALLGVLGDYRAYINIIGRLLCTLGLTCTMGVVLLMALQVAHLPQGPAHWAGLELIWLFVLLSGCMLLFWAGVTQRLLLSAQEILESGEENF